MKKYKISNCRETFGGAVHRKVIGADKKRGRYLEGKRLCLKMENLSETQRSK